MPDFGFDEQHVQLLAELSINAANSRRHSRSITASTLDRDFVMYLLARGGLVETRSHDVGTQGNTAEQARAEKVSRAWNVPIARTRAVRGEFAGAILDESHRNSDRLLGWWPSWECHAASAGRRARDDRVDDRFVKRQLRAFERAKHVISLEDRPLLFKPILCEFLILLRCKVVDLVAVLKMLKERP